MNATPTTNRWIVRPRPNTRARLRLLCIAHAGGGASAFRGWADVLPPEVEVLPVQLPGRENRIMEAPFDRVAPLVEALADAVEPFLDQPFAMFGHSNGALIGFELSRTLRARGRPGPVHFFASGRRAPDLPADRGPTHQLPEPEFLADLQELGGLPAELLAHEELLSLLVPTLRADVAIHETYQFTEQEPLDVPLTAYGGIADPKVQRHQVEAWARHTRGPFAVRMFPGGHFFLQDDRALFLRTLSIDLHQVLDAVKQ
ncbi:MAG TPA: thioesterase domain-containing protein [Longimicrobium sp.]|nr:thioesterase domain-containing protein [Longimicrobium sp.]